MPGVSTTHHISRGVWEVYHYADPTNGETVFSIALVENVMNVVQICGFNAASLDELIHALKAARQDADTSRMADRIDRLLPPRDCPGVDLAEAARRTS